MDSSTASAALVATLSAVSSTGSVPDRILSEGVSVLLPAQDAVIDQISNRDQVSRLAGELNILHGVSLVPQIAGNIGATVPNVEFSSLARRVQAALEDDSWDFRSARGISRELDIPIDVVERELDRGRMSRKALFRGGDGEFLFTARNRKVSVSEAWRAISQLIVNEFI